MTGPERLDQLLRLHSRSAWRRVAWIVMILTTAVTAWAALTKLDEVAVAEGEVVPQEKVKVIQHLEGGIIERIFVEEGAQVMPGDPLVGLELAVTGMNVEELRIELDGLVLAQARLEAEIRGRAVELPRQEAQRSPSLAEAELRTHAARDEERRSRLLSLGEQAQQRKLAIKELKAARGAVWADLELAKQHLGISDDLLRDGLTSRIEHLGRVREVKQLQGQLASLAPAIPKAEAALRETEEKLRETELMFRRQAMDELRRTELEIVRTRELLRVALGQDNRTTIRSPTKGVVKNLGYHTIGGVVRPGDPIMEIVPSDGVLVIEAKLNPADRGYVSVGQTARAKISTYDFIRYGALAGEIVQIAADSTIDQNGEPYFRVLMQPDAAHLGDGNNKLPIMPGMVATVDIKTGSKSVLSYIVEPVLRIKEEAFRERL